MIDFKEHSKKEDVCEFLGQIKDDNTGKRIIIVLDNFRSHRAKATLEFAAKNKIDLVFLSPYSPDLNLIEYIWKNIKRIISREFIRDVEHMRSLIRKGFTHFSSKISFAKAWIETFVDEEYKLEMLGY